MKLNWFLFIVETFSRLKTTIESHTSNQTMLLVVLLSHYKISFLSTDSVVQNNAKTYNNLKL